MNVDLQIGWYRRSPRTRNVSWGGLLGCAGIFALTVGIGPVLPRTARAQEYQAASASNLAGISLPANAVRVAPARAPDSLMKALQNVIKSAGSKVKQGKTEIIAWTGSDYKATQVAGIKESVSGALKAAGWSYEESTADPKVGTLTMVSSVRTTPTRKGVIGFWVPTDDALLLAWTEMLPVAAASTAEAPAEKPATPVAQPATFTVVASQQCVNVMKGVNPKLPTFPALTPKKGMVRGYVKDAKGNPIKGAVIGVRSTMGGGFYSGASAKSDAKGYYEITVPWGAASFYAAGYTIDYGDGRAAMGLHPADGEADSFASANGLVENWVLLSYGVADRDKASENPQYSGNYYGGSFSVGYYVEDSQWPDNKSLPAGSEIELTLTPDGPLIDGSQGKPFVIRRPVQEGSPTSFYVNNVPVGRYRIAARLLQNGNATLLSMRETGPYGNQPFGLEPKEGKEGVTLLFRPGGAQAGMATAAHGNWNSLDITLGR